MKFVYIAVALASLPAFCDPCYISKQGRIVEIKKTLPRGVVFSDLGSPFREYLLSEEFFKQYKPSDCPKDIEALL